MGGGVQLQPFCGLAPGNIDLPIRRRKGDLSRDELLSYWTLSFWLTAISEVAELLLQRSSRANKILIESNELYYKVSADESRIIRPRHHIA